MAPAGPDSGLALKDPAKRRNLTFAMLPMTKLDVISHRQVP